MRGYTYQDCFEYNRRKNSTTHAGHRASEVAKAVTMQVGRGGKSQRAKVFVEQVGEEDSGGHQEVGRRRYLKDQIVKKYSITHAHGVDQVSNQLQPVAALI